MTTETPIGELPEAVARAQSWLAEARGLSAEQVIVSEYHQTDWSDSCLGLGGPAEICAAVITPGWRVDFSVNGAPVEVRTDASGEVIRAVTPPAAANLTDATWTLVSFGPEGDESPIVPGSEITLSFMDGEKIAGSAGCNRYGGGYQRDGDNLTFSEVFSTRMACQPDEVMTQEQAYLAALNGVQRFELTATGLRLWTDEGRQVLNFTAQPAATAADLTDTTWKLESFGPEGQEAPLVADSEVTLTFLEDQKIGGSSGCNQYGGSYELDGQSLTFSEILGTLMACQPDEVMTQEQAYLAALNDVQRFELTASSLRLWTADDGTVLNFTAQP
jgi:heat shock protein HslJ